MKRVEKKTPPAYEPVGYIELLRGNRSFRQLWLGQVVSQMGDWFDTIALYTIIQNLTGSGRDIGLLLVARFVPSFFLGPLSGVVADRFSRQGRHAHGGSDRRGLRRSGCVDEDPGPQQPRPLPRAG